MPILSNSLAKIVSLCLFVLTTAIKVVSVIVLSSSADSICMHGGHLSDEAAMHLQLVALSLISDVIMILCISIGLPLKICNMGADPASIIYNFLVGLITFCGIIPFLGVKNCKSSDFSKIQMMGFIAPVSGILHIVNAVLGLLSLSIVERTPPVRPMLIDLDGVPTTSSAKPGKSAKSAKPTTTPAKPSKTPAKPAKTPAKPTKKPAK